MYIYVADIVVEVITKTTDSTVELLDFWRTKVADIQLEIITKTKDSEIPPQDHTWRTKVADLQLEIITKTKDSEIPPQDHTWRTKVADLQLEIITKTQPYVQPIYTYEIDSLLSNVSIETLYKEQRKVNRTPVSSLVDSVILEVLYKNVARTPTRNYISMINSSSVEVLYKNNKVNFSSYNVKLASFSVETLYKNEKAVSKYKFSGQTLNGIIASDNTVYAFDNNTNLWVGSTASTGGVFELGTTVSGLHTLVCLDNTNSPEYNDLVVASIKPYLNLSALGTVGSTKGNPADSAEQILLNSEVARVGDSRTYWLNTFSQPKLLYCDMLTDRKAWVKVVDYEYNKTIKPLNFVVKNGAWFTGFDSNTGSGSAQWLEIHRTKEDLFKYSELIIKIIPKFIGSPKDFNILDTYELNKVNGHYCDGISITAGNVHIHTITNVNEGAQRLENELHWIEDDYSFTNHEVEKVITKSLQHEAETLTVRVMLSDVTGSTDIGFYKLQIFIR